MSSANLNDKNDVLFGTLSANLKEKILYVVAQIMLKIFGPGIA